MNDLDTLRSVLDERGARADHIHADRADIGRRSARYQRGHRAAVASTSVVLVAGAVVGTAIATRGGGDRDIVRTDRAADSLAPATAPIPLPVDIRRTLDDGREVSITAKVRRPTYGPYGDDHLSYPAAHCPAEAVVSTVTPEDIGAGGGFGMDLPLDVDPRQPRAFATRQPRADLGNQGPPSFEGPSDLVVIVAGTAPGYRYDLVDENGVVLDTAVATDRATALVAESTEPFTAGREQVGPNVTVRFDNSAHDVTSVIVRWVDPRGIVPAECWPANRPVELPDDSQFVEDGPADPLEAGAAVSEAIATTLAPTTDAPDRSPVHHFYTRWESPTSAWVKYRILFFAESPDAGPVFWAQVVKGPDGWAVTPDARCVYERFWGGDCSHAPDTQPVE